MGCGTCHAFGTRAIAPSPVPVAIEEAELARGKALAPDLRHTRERFRPRALVRWLEDPKGVKPDTAMPGIKLTAQQALPKARVFPRHNGRGQVRFKRGWGKGGGWRRRPAPLLEQHPKAPEAAREQ